MSKVDALSHTLPPARDLTIVRGRGPWLWDDSGNTFVDLGISLGVAALGHGHPAVVAAIHRQVEELVALGTSAHNPVREEFARALVACAPRPGMRAFLCNSGAEAVEAALKFAKGATGRPGIVAAYRGFHGRTLGALSVTYRPEYREPFGPLVPGVTFVPFGNAGALAKAVEDTTAAVILEPVQGEGGVHPAPPGYLEEARSICNGHGSLLILDEVQTGLGRTGRMWACQADGVEPDILTTSKALGGGLPLGATLVTEAVDDAVKGGHHSTFGGNPLACAAGLATLTTILKGRLWERAELMGREALKALEGLPGLKEVRGRGLMVGLELRDRAAPVLRGLQEQGFLASMAGSMVLRLLPPLTLDEDLWTQGLGAIGKVIHAG